MNATPNTHPPGSPVWREPLAIALLLALVCLLAWPGMTAPLLLDDLDHVTQVSGFSSWRDCWGQDAFGLFRPVKNLVYYGLRDLSLFRWHALNLSVYLGAVVAVALFLKRMLNSFAWAFGATLVWATSPTQASSAVWMAAVNISLAVILGCACLWLHDLSRHNPARQARSAGFIALTAVLLFGAVCSYETAICIPALCVLVDSLRKRALFSREALIRYVILGAVTLCYLAIRSHVGALVSQQVRNGGFSPDLKGWQLTLSAPWFLWKHFSMWLMPAGRIECYSSYLWGISATPWALAAAWVWLGVVIGVISVTWKRQPWIASGLLWFLIASFPPSNFIPVWSGPIEDYYLIFPGIGLAIALVGGAKALVEWIGSERLNPESQSQLIGGAVLVLAVCWRLSCIPLFWLQADLWSRPLDLFLQIHRTRPGQYQAQSLAARELMLGGNLPAAKELAQQSHDRAPWHGESGIILGCVALATADYDEAENRLGEVLRLTPSTPLVAEYARLYLAKTFMAREAKRHLVRETLLPLLNNPQSTSHLAAIHLQLDCYLAQNQPAAAHRAAVKAVQLHPHNRKLLARLQDIEQRFPESVAPPPPQP